jgi:hypothetical protein
VEEEEQRVIAKLGQEECPAIQWVSNALPTMLVNNPTSKRILQSKARTHQCTTQKNMPSALPKITQPDIAPPLQANTRTPFAAPHMIHDMLVVAMAHKVPQQQAWKTKTVATDMAPRGSM